jgi:hypothetical protein
MRLVSQKVLVLGLGLTIGCHDSTAPATPSSQLYVLESVNGQSVPVNLGGSTTIVWATLTLDVVGNATTVDHNRSVFQGDSSENTVSLRRQYRVRGDSIEIGSFTPCPPGADCIGNTLGVLADSSIALTVGYISFPSNPIIYLYRLIPTF